MPELAKEGLPNPRRPALCERPAHGRFPSGRWAYWFFALRLALCCRQRRWLN
jgi:hypothetical protein